MADLNGMYGENDAPASFDVIPNGDYLAMIVASEEKKTQSGDGSSYIALTFEILDGQYKGRKLWANFNLKNKSAEAVKIAKGEFAALRKAIGVMSPKDTIELHNLPVVIGVRCKKRSDTDEMTNVIKSYKSRSATPAATDEMTNVIKSYKSRSATPAAGGPAPWKRESLK